MGIGGGSVLVPWRPAFWIAAEVVLFFTLCVLSAQEPASVSGPGVWRGASGPMPAPYDGERRVRSEGQKGREAFYVYISSLQYSEGKSAQ